MTLPMTKIIFLNKPLHEENQQNAKAKLEMRVCKTLCPQLYACP